MKMKKGFPLEISVLSNNISVGNPLKKAILVVSFGTSYNKSREATIGAVENKIIKAFADYDVRRAFTSQMIINKLEKRDGIVIDNVTEAMERLVRDDIGTLVIQPTHVMSGFEYDDMVKDIKPYEKFFASVSYGVPLLYSDADYLQTVEIITIETTKYNNEDTAIVFMGHGTQHEANASYAKLDRCLKESGYSNYFIGTVEAKPSLLEVIEAVKNISVTKVILQPFMIVAGDHANNDMASDKKASWKTAFREAGFEVECVIRGMGEMEKIQDMFVEHCGYAIQALNH